jgi:ATP-binding cassette, subfamily B (MDR/TAP), member 1
MTSIRISAALRLTYMQSLFAQPVSKLDELPAGAVVNTITSSSNTIQMSISDKLSVLLQSLALLIAAYAIAFRYSWALTLVASAPLLFILIAFSLTVPLVVKLQQRVDKADEKHASVAAEVFGSIRTVFSLSAERTLSNHYSWWVEESRKQALKTSLPFGIQIALMFFAMYSNFALSFWFGSRLYQNGSIASIGTVIM